MKPFDLLRSGTFLSRGSGQRGNVFAMLFAAVALTGVLASVGMQTLTGPVTTITRVTQKNIADNNLLMNIKILVSAAVTGTDGGDGDGDGIIEPAQYVAAGGGETPPSNGGFLPTTLGLVLTDPWGTKFGYCVWDHGSTSSSTRRLSGDPAAAAGQPVIAVITAGPDKIFQTSCPTYTSGVISVSKAAGSDDLIQKYSYAEATASSNGLWQISKTDSKKAELKNSAGDEVKVSINRDTGIGDFLGLLTSAIESKVGELIAIGGALKLDTAGATVDTCDATAKGAARLNASETALELCDGAGAWVPASAPRNATYITQTPNADLTNEQALSALATGVVKVTTGTGVLTSGAVDLGTAEATGILADARFPALTGDVTTVAGSVAATIAANAVTNAKLAQMAAGTIKGNNTSGAADPLDLTGTEVTAMLDVFGASGGSAAKGLVPSPGGVAGSTKYLREDGTWGVPPGTFTLSDGDKGDIVVSGGGGVWNIDAGVVDTAKLADEAVTFAKMQNIDNGKLLGRSTAGNGDVEEINVGLGLSLSGGSLTLGSIGGSQITDDSLDFTEFMDAMTLDSSTDIAVDGTNELSITNTGTGNSLIVNDDAADTSPFVVDAAGKVGIGLAAPASALHIEGAADSNMLRIDSYGTTSTKSHIVGYSANGTKAAPTATLNDDYLLSIGARGYGATGFPTNEKVAIRLRAFEDWSDTAQATMIDFITTTGMSTSPSIKMRLSAAGRLMIGTTTGENSAQLDVTSSSKGFLPPRMTDVQVAAIAAPADGLIVYDSVNDVIKLRANGSWVSLTTSATSVSAAGNDGSVQFKSGTGLAADATNFHWDDTNDRLGIGTNTPSSDISLGGAAARKIAMEANSVANTAGQNLTIQAGSATTGATDKWGGDLYIRSGNGTGSGGSNIYLQVARGYQSSGTTSRPATADGITILGTASPGVGINWPWPDRTLDVNGNAGIRYSSNTVGFTNGTILRFLNAGSSWAAYGAYEAGIQANTTGAESGFLSLRTRNAGTLAERMRITADGSVGVNTSTPDASAVMDLTSTTKGFLPPRMADTDVTAITSPADGLIVYDTVNDVIKLRANGSWVSMSTSATAVTAAGSDGSVQFKSGSSLAADASNLHWDDTNNRLGIGNNAPTKTLDVTGDVKASGVLTLSSSSATSLVFSVAGSTTGFGADSGSNLSVYTNGSQRGYFTSSGALNWYGQIIAGGTYLAPTGSATYPAFAFSGWPNYTNGMFYPTTNSLAFSTNATERLRINATGSVGVGTTAPDASSILDLTSTTLGFLPPRMTDVQQAAITSPVDGLIVYDTVNDVIKLRANSAWVSLATTAGLVTPAGSDGSIQFKSGTSLAADATKLHWDDTNNRLGVGNNAPAYELDVSGNFRATNSITIGNAATAAIYGRGDIRLYWPSDAVGTNTNGASISLRYSHTDSSVANNDVIGSINFQANNPTWTPYTVARLTGQADGTMTATSLPSRLGFYTTPSGATAPTERMRIDSSGRVGIGITDFTNISSRKLAVDGSVQVGAGGVKISSAGAAADQSHGWTLCQNCMTSPGSEWLEIFGHNSTGGIKVTNQSDTLFNQTGGVFKIQGAGTTFVAADSASRAVIIGGATVDASAVLDVTSATKGFLPPRMTDTDVAGITAPADGLIVYDTVNDVIKLRANGAWVSMSTSATAVSAAGSDGSIQFKSGTSLAADASNLHFDDTNDRLGVGTNTPSYAFSLGGEAARTIGMERRSSANSGGSDLTIQAGGATSGASNKAGGNLYLSSGVPTGSGISHMFFNVYPSGSSGTTDGSAYTALSLRGDGKVGFGTASPTYSFSLNGESGKTIAMERRTVADSNGYGLTVQSGGATSGATDKSGGDLILSSGISTGTGNSEILFKVHPAGTTGTTDTTATTAVTIKSTGKVGIGTTNPGSKLTVYGGTFAVENDGTSTINASRMYTDANPNGFITTYRARGTSAVPAAVQAGDAIMMLAGRGYHGTNWANGGSDIRFYAGETWTTTSNASYMRFFTTPSGSSSQVQRMSILADGRVGIGANADASAILEVASTSLGFLPPRMTDAEVAGITAPADGLIAYDTVNDVIKLRANGAWVSLVASASGAAGDVTGPASATDNAVARFDGTTGKLLQNSTVTIGDTGAVAGVTTLDTTDKITVTNATAAEQLRLAYDSTHYANIAVTAGGGLNIDATANIVWMQDFVKFYQGLSTNNNYTGNFTTGGVGMMSSTDSYLLLGGSTTTNLKTSFYGSYSSVLGAGSSYGSVLFGAAPITEGTSGAHPIISNVAVKPLAVTDGTATTTNAATVYVEGAATGITPTGGNYSLWVDSGDTRLDGSLLVKSTSALADLSVTATTNNWGEGIEVFPASNGYGGVFFRNAANTVSGTWFAGRVANGTFAVTKEDLTTMEGGNNRAPLVANTNGDVTLGRNLGIRTASPSYTLSFGGAAARTIGVERHSTANTAGSSLTIQAGAATSGATDKSGGDLILSSGVRTGTGTSNILFKTYAAGSTGTTDGTASTPMTIFGDGRVAIGTSIPAINYALTVSGHVRGWTLHANTFYTGGGSPAASAVADFSSTTKGLLPPRMTDAEVAGIVSPTDGLIAYDTVNDILKLYANGAWVSLVASASGAAGDVTGPASATDNAVARFDGTTGKLLQNSTVTIDDTGAVAGVTTLDTTGKITATAATGEQLRLAYDATNYVTLESQSDGALNLDTTGGRIYVQKMTNFYDGLSTASNGDNANFRTSAYGGSAAMESSASQFQLSGATNTAFRTSFYGATASALTAGDSYASVLFGGAPITEAASGTHPILANVAIKAPAFTNAAGATTNATTLYVEGAPTGVTPTGAPYALWVDSGVARFDGEIKAYVGTASAPAYSFAQDGTTGMYFPSAASLGFATGGVQRLRINASGYVGIDTSTPSYDLSFGGDVARTIGQERHTTADTAGSALTVQAGGATSGATDKNGGDLVLSSGTSTGTGYSKITFKTASAGTTGTVDNAPTAAVTVLGQKLGIGITNPGAPLHMSSESYTTMLLQDVYNDSNPSSFMSRRARGTVAAPAAVQSGDEIFTIGARGYGATGWASGSRASFKMKAAENWTDTANGTYMSFLTTDAGSTTLTERVRLDSAGRLLVGTTTASGSALLEVSSTSKGFLPPRMTDAEVAAITSPDDGLIAYDTVNDVLKLRANGAWVSLAGGTGITDGDKGDITVASSGTVWTVDDDALDFTELADSLSLDASTDIAVTGTNVLSITNTGTGHSFVVNDQASDTTPFIIDQLGKVSIGAAGSIPSLFALALSSQFPASWTTTGPRFASLAATYTDNSSPAASTVTTRALHSFAIPTLASTNAITVTNAANVYIDGAPAAGTNTTITNPYALYAAAGNSYFGGNIGVGRTPSYAVDASGSVRATTSFIMGTYAEGFLDKYRLNLYNYGDAVGTNTGYPTVQLRYSHVDTSLAVGDTIGSLDFMGNRPVDWQGKLMARVAAQVEDVVSSTSMPGRLVFYTTTTGATVPSEKARLTQAGNFGIGETAPDEKLVVAGNVKATAYLNTSDRRLKDNIKDLSGLEIIRELRGVSFVWKQTGKEAMGLIAQEVEGVLPFAVATDSKGYKSVDYIMMIAPMIESIKALDTQVISLLAENAALKARVDSLENTVQSLEARLKAIEEKLGATVH